MANIYSPKKLGALIGRSLNALQRWGREEVLPAKRTPTNRLCYIHEDYLRVIGPKRRRNVEPSSMPESPTLGKGGGSEESAGSTGKVLSGTKQNGGRTAGGCGQRTNLQEEEFPAPDGDGGTGRDLLDRGSSQGLDGLVRLRMVREVLPGSWNPNHHHERRIPLSRGRDEQGSPFDHSLLFKPSLRFAQIQKKIEDMVKAKEDR